MSYDNLHRIVINKEDYFGMAADGLRNFDLWNVAHVAAASVDKGRHPTRSPNGCVPMLVQAPFQQVSHI